MTPWSTRLAAVAATLQAVADLAYATAATVEAKHAPKPASAPSVQVLTFDGPPVTAGPDAGRAILAALDDAPARRRGLPDPLTPIQG